MECPRCRSHGVYRSKRGNEALPFFAKWFLVALRCHNCSHELVRFAPLCTVKSKPEKPNPQPSTTEGEMERIRLPRMGAGS